MKGYKTSINHGYYHRTTRKSKSGKRALRGPNELDNDQKIALLSVYIEDRNHRDGVGTDQLLKVFYASIIIGMLPNLSGILGVSINIIPSIVFRILGIIIAIIFIHIASAYADRLNAISSTYSRIIKTLPRKYRRDPINPVYDKFMSSWISKCMFFAALAIQITMLVTDIIQMIH